MASASQDPVYGISVAARIVGVHAQTLRGYEREGLVHPARSRGGVRLYSQADIEQLRRIRRFVEVLGVNLAGVDVILTLSDRIKQLEKNLKALRKDLQRERDRHLPVPRDQQPASET